MAEDLSVKRVKSEPEISQQKSSNMERNVSEDQDSSYSSSMSSSDVIEGNRQDNEAKPEMKRRKSVKPQKAGSSSPQSRTSGTNEAAAGCRSGSSSANVAAKKPAYQHDFELEMNLSDPLVNLIRQLQPSVNYDLSQAAVYLCGVQKLDHETCLRDCVRDGALGIVKVKVTLIVTVDHRAHLNIIDVLQPVPESPAQPAKKASKSTARPKKSAISRKSASAVEELVVRSAKKSAKDWAPSETFRALRDAVRIPMDPADWNTAHVGHWLSWATQTFSLPTINMKLFTGLTGKDICSITQGLFIQLVGKDAHNWFWTHLELLRSSGEAMVPSSLNVLPKTSPASPIVTGKRTSAMRSIDLFAKESSGTIQLWQFLLELLACDKYRDCLEWSGDEGEFRLINPERVAELWGLRKNKCNMNYEKMSRALRYYYDGEILAKVPGKHFTYKFICDLKKLVGYSYNELAGSSSPIPSSLPPSTPGSSRESTFDSEDGFVPQPKRRKSANPRASRAAQIAA